MPAQIVPRHNNANSATVCVALLSRNLAQTPKEGSYAILSTFIIKITTRCKKFYHVTESPWVISFLPHWFSTQAHCLLPSLSLGISLQWQLVRLFDGKVADHTIGWVSILYLVWSYWSLKPIDPLMPARGRTPSTRESERSQRRPPAGRPTLKRTTARCGSFPITVFLTFIAKSIHFRTNLRSFFCFAHRPSSLGSSFRRRILMQWFPPFFSYFPLSQDYSLEQETPASISVTQPPIRAWSLLWNSKHRLVRFTFLISIFLAQFACTSLRFQSFRYITKKTNAFLRCSCICGNYKRLFFFCTNHPRLCVFYVRCIEVDNHCYFTPLFIVVCGVFPPFFRMRSASNINCVPLSSLVWAQLSGPETPTQRVTTHTGDEPLAQ